jgi:hypothetical protein
VHIHAQGIRLAFEIEFRSRRMRDAPEDLIRPTQGVPRIAPAGLPGSSEIEQGRGFAGWKLCFEY